MADAVTSRDELQKVAEKHQRQGRNDLAIDAYERLAGITPTDWNVIKQLADLLERVGHREAAAARFLELADHYGREGFNTRAAALYRKVLKLEPQSEHALCQLAEVSLQLKLAVDARQAWTQVITLRQRRGDHAGADAIKARLAALGASTPASRAAALAATAQPADIQTISRPVGAPDAPPQELAPASRSQVAPDEACEGGGGAQHETVLAGLVPEAFEPTHDVPRAEESSEATDSAVTAPTEPFRVPAPPGMTPVTARPSPHADLRGPAALLSGRLRTLALDAESRGDLAAAQRAWSAVLHIEPGDRDVRMKLLAQALKREDVEAVALLVTALPLSNADDRAWHFRAVRLTRPGETDPQATLATRVEQPEALAVYLTLAADDPSAADDWVTVVAAVRARTGAPEAVSAFAEAAHALRPLPIAALRHWVEACIDGHLPALDTAQFALAETCLLLGLPADARIVTDQLLRRQPDRADVCALARRVHEACGETVEVVPPQGPSQDATSIEESLSPGDARSYDERPTLDEEASFDAGAALDATTFDACVHVPSQEDVPASDARIPDAPLASGVDTPDESVGWTDVALDFDDGRPSISSEAHEAVGLQTVGLTAHEPVSAEDAPESLDTSHALDASAALDMEAIPVAEAASVAPEAGATPEAPVAAASHASYESLATFDWGSLLGRDVPVHTRPAGAVARDDARQAPEAGASGSGALEPPTIERTAAWAADGVHGEPLADILGVAGLAGPGQSLSVAAAASTDGDGAPATEPGNVLEDMPQDEIDLTALLDDLLAGDPPALPVVEPSRRSAPAGAVDADRASAGATDNALAAAAVMDDDVGEATGGASHVGHGPPWRTVAGGEPTTHAENERSTAAQQVAAGRVFAAAGLVAEAARAFERASREVRTRFEAAQALADLHRSRGQLPEAIRWFEVAAQAPTPDAAVRRPVLYDLAETLETVGQADRALAVWFDLLSEVEDYRDARVRADRLLRVDAGG